METEIPYRVHRSLPEAPRNISQHGVLIRREVVSYPPNPPPTSSWRIAPCRLSV